jgi:predicted RNase H-like HicB family nuclease
MDGTDTMILLMRTEITAVIKKDGDWFVGWSLDIPGANGQGPTVEECRENIAAAIELILDDQGSTGRQ